MDDIEVLEMKRKITAYESLLKEFADPFNWEEDGYYWTPGRVDLQAEAPANLADRVLEGK